jgi:hypothetical protein
LELPGQKKYRADGGAPEFALSAVQVAVALQGK